jgi:DNA-directed RNA polymerase specialized sigma subunit
MGRGLGMTAVRADKIINVEKLIEQAVKKAVNVTFMLGAERAKREVKDVFKQTEIRLYAYPELKRNIEKYKLDIQDLYREGSSGKSKDLVFFSTQGGGIRLTDDEIQEARVMVLQKKIYRDQAEIDEIDYALQAVENDEYYSIIRMRYFEEQSDEEIAVIVGCDPRTIRRNKSRLVHRIAVKLYGAEAVG